MIWVFFYRSTIKVPIGRSIITYVTFKIIYCGSFILHQKIFKCKVDMKRQSKMKMDESYINNES